MNVLSRIETTVPSATTGIYHGWLIVVAAFVIACFGWGIGFYGPGIYLVALQQRHGWPMADISTAITTYYLLGATLILSVGGVFERFGARLTVATGAIAMACGIVLLTLVACPWHVYAAFAVMSFGWAAMSGAAINIIIAPWFDKRRGLAISLALNGASAGGVVIAPLLIFLVGRLNFAAALSCVAVLMLVVILLTAAFVLRCKRIGERDAADEGGDPMRTQPPVPVPAAQAPLWQLSAVLRSRDFQTISVPFALGLVAQVGFLTHQVAYLSPNLGAAGAGWSVSVTTSAAVVGRLLVGLFVDKLDRRGVACGNFLVQSAGMALLAANSSAPMLYFGCTLRPRPWESDLASRAHHSAGVPPAILFPDRWSDRCHQPVRLRIRTRTSWLSAAGKRQLHERLRSLFYCPGDGRGDRDFPAAWPPPRPKAGKK